MVEKFERQGADSSVDAELVSLATASGDLGGRTIQSVERALNVLEIVAQERDGVTVSVISERLGLNISTCHHLITTLVKKGFVTHLGRIKGYALGPRLGELVQISEGERDPDVLLAGELKALGASLGHGVQFAVLRDTSLMTKLSFPGTDDKVVEPDEVEKMSALHATATGKAILAWIPDTELVRIISANGLSSYTPETITTLSGLVEELRLVRRRKYSIDDQEFSEGIVCIGATIRAGAGAVIGSISVTIPADRATDDYRDFLIKEMIAAANSFSNKLRDLKI
ncbi:acetate operon repressor [Roseovarius sp. A-2]|uniref:IclR family transcriptional regulator n=1 Tax=Roseovarius sp. A-2 TaxID=1570360 RepID=UPI0009B50576|nr:IclR family transcriptional regulator [Roseovarius sp. A-2]GAW33657.1 acetate operon repressor [Roseovarius sp. A-2]